MKKSIFIATLFFCFNTAIAQLCGITDSLQDRWVQSYNGYIGNGGIFSPRGDLRILVVFVHLGEPFDSNDNSDWPIGAKFPNWYTDSNKKVFYSSIADFSSNIYDDTNRFSLSNFYYQMSHGRFRLMADYYPDTVVIHLEQNDSWEKANIKALQRIPSSFDWSRYDNRTNRPYFQDSNTVVSHDGIVDYIVFCYRFDWKWGISMPWRMYMGNANGFSTTDIEPSISVGTGMYVSTSGFTMMTGYYEPIILFPHEIGHELYNAPHYNGGNGETGNYFYMPTSGWGMMNIAHGYTSALGWERYVLDWTPRIKASGVPSDINDSCDLTTTNGIYTLQDFITTGDALRIKVTAGNDTYQYLWLENHQGVSIFDGSVHGKAFCGDSIEEYKIGLVAYVEEYSHVKNTNYIDLISKNNAIRWLSRNGDKDITYESTPIYPYCLCNTLAEQRNKTYPMLMGKSNPIGGQNINEYICNDYDESGQIDYYDYFFAVKIDNEEPTAKWINGAGMQFHKGDKVGIATNPTVKNMPKYDKNTCKMGDYYLNGISFEVLNENADGSISVKIRLDDVAVDHDVRWAAASVALMDITGDSRPDVDVMPNITLTIDKSGTPNRHVNPENQNPVTPDVNNFITPTTFTCRSGSYFKQEPYSTVKVQEYSSLVIDSGAVYEVGNHASLEITTKSTLLVRRGATLRVLGTGHVEIGDLSNICIEDGANIHLVDTLSAINIMHSSTCGVNSQGSAPAGNCTTTNLVNFPLVTGSHGAIHRFSRNAKYIQNKIYTNKTYVYGNAIYAGNHVIPIQAIHTGDVVVKNGSHVIWDAANGVHLDPGVRVEAGGVLEVR